MGAIAVFGYAGRIGSFLMSNPNMVGIQCDVRDEGSIEATLPETISGMVYAAGIQTYGGIETSRDTLLNTLEVHVFGALSAARQCAKRMPNGGNMVFLGSSQSCGPLANSTAYVASKHALLGLVRSLSLELAPKIRCHILLLGPVQPAEEHQAAIKLVEEHSAMRGCVSLKDIAGAVDWLLATESITGTELWMDSGLSLALGGMAFNREVNQ